MMKNLETLDVYICPLWKFPFIMDEGETGGRAFNKLSSTDHKCMLGLKNLELLYTDMSDLVLLLPCWRLAH